MMDWSGNGNWYGYWWLPMMLLMVAFLALVVVVVVRTTERLRAPGVAPTQPEDSDAGKPLR